MADPTTPARPQQTELAGRIAGTFGRLRSHPLLGLSAAACVALAIAISLWWISLPDPAGLAVENPSETAYMRRWLRKERAEGRSPELHWTWVPSSAISPHLQRAVVAAEDHGFFLHEGVDWEQVEDAARKAWEGGDLRGASTLTMQTARNLYLSPGRTPWRKWNEVVIARRMERALTKERILEIYLNVVEWGGGIWGAEAASRYWFGKPARELDLEESLWLAAMLPAPRRFDPRNPTPELIARRQAVAERLQRWGVPGMPGDMGPDPGGGFRQGEGGSRSESKE